jgi:hypothetical protein
MVEEKLSPDLTGKPTMGGFKIFRQIANLALYRENESNRVYENAFDLPIQIYVGYSFYDLMKARCDLNNLKLFFFEDDLWKLFENDDRFEYRILPPDTAQVAVVTVHAWPSDPPLAWGG